MNIVLHLINALLNVRKVRVFRNSALRADMEKNMNYFQFKSHDIMSLIGLFWKIYITGTLSMEKSNKV